MHFWVSHRGARYNYQIQVKRSDSSYIFLGAMKYKEALRNFFLEADRSGSKTGFIWPQTKVAEKKFRNMGSVDYVQVVINEYGRLVITPKTISSIGTATIVERIN